MVFCLCIVRFAYALALTCTPIADAIQHTNPCSREYVREKNPIKSHRRWCPLLIRMSRPTAHTQSLSVLFLNFVSFACQMSWISPAAASGCGYECAQPSFFACKNLYTLNSHWDCQPVLSSLSVPFRMNFVVLRALSYAIHYAYSERRRVRCMPCIILCISRLCSVHRDIADSCRDGLTWIRPMQCGRWDAIRTARSFFFFHITISP